MDEKLMTEEEKTFDFYEGAWARWWLEDVDCMSNGFKIFNVIPFSDYFDESL